MKRRLVTKLMMAAGVAAMAVTTIPASVFAAEDGGQTYGVTYWCESDFFKTVADSITEEAEADGNKTVVVDAQQDSAKQIQIIEDFIAQGVSAVFLNPVDKDAIEPALQKLDEAGIPVVNFDTSVSNLDLVGSYVATDNYQGNAVVNYTSADVPYTRIIEHKHFNFGKQPVTIISREYSSEWKKGDEPYYPVNDSKNSLLYNEYRELANAEENVIFGGRLGEYKYYDMDQVIAAALTCVEREIK